MGDEHVYATPNQLILRMLGLLRECHDYMCEEGSFAAEWAVSKKVKDFLEELDGEVDRFRAEEEKLDKEDQ